VVVFLFPAFFLFLLPQRFAKGIKVMVTKTGESGTIAVLPLPVSYPSSLYMSEADSFRCHTLKLL